MFNAQFRQLNAAKPFVFSNKGLIDGVISKREVRTGLVKYYTSNYRIHATYSAAKAVQIVLNMLLPKH